MSNQDATTQPPRAPAQRLDCAGVATEVWQAEAAAGAPTLLCLHGSADSAAAFRPLAAALGAHGPASLAIVAPQLPSFGGPADSSVPASALDFDLAWLDALMAQTGARQLFGHSYGALLALRWALSHPGRLDRLILGEPICWHLLDDPSTPDARPRLLEAQCLQPFAAGADEQAMEWLVDYWNRQGFWRDLPPKVQNALLAGARRTELEVKSGSQDLTTREELSCLRVETVVLFGADTTRESQAVCAALAAALPHGRLVRLPGVGHQFLRPCGAVLAELLLAPTAAASASA